MLQSIEKDEILALAKGIQDENKRIAAAKELKRFNLVKDLIVTIESLAPEKSESIIKDLLKIGKPKDFQSYFVFISEFKGQQFENVAFYNGIEITILKQNGNISKRSLPWKSLVKFHLCDFNSFLNSSLLTERNGLGIDAKDLFETFEYSIIGEFTDKGSNVIDTNKAKIYSNTLQNKGLKVRNSENRKAEILAQKEAKNAAKKKVALSKIEAANKVLAKLS